MISRSIRSALVVAVILVVAALPLYAQDQDAILAREAFIRPPDKIAEAVMAPRHLNVTLDDVVRCTTTLEQPVLERLNRDAGVDRLEPCLQRTQAGPRIVWVEEFDPDDIVNAEPGLPRTWFV